MSQKATPPGKADGAHVTPELAHKLETIRAAPGDSLPANVVPLFTEPVADRVESLTSEEVILLRQMMREWAVIRASCPMAIRLLSKR